MQVIYICSEAFTLRSNNYNLYVATRYQCIYSAVRKWRGNNAFAKSLWKNLTLKRDCHVTRVRWKIPQVLLLCSISHATTLVPHILIFAWTNVAIFILVYMLTLALFLRSLHTWPEWPFFFFQMWIIFKPLLLAGGEGKQCCVYNVVVDLDHINGFPFLQ